MKISLNWIKDYVSIGITTDRLVHKLTMAGLEVEQVSTVGNDIVLDLEITPNRSDCLNMVGMAREIAAILNKTYEPPKIKPIKFSAGKLKIQNEDKKDCGRYIGTVIENVEVGRSAQWMKKRLEALEIKSINNVVDITNFCLLELGQPLHAFDYDKIIGGKIFIRRAKKGETIVTLDNVERILDSSILVIADAERPVAIAGIMGGKETEVTDQTKNILLESASFDATLIRRAVRTLKLTSDSAYRFERGVNFEMVEKCKNRAVSLILHNAKGKVTQQLDGQFVTAKVSPVIELSLEQINNYLGANLLLKDCVSILKRLEFEIISFKKNILKVKPPYFRSDIKESVDIIEEVARIIGYDNLPSSLPYIKAENIEAHPRKKIRTKIGQMLVGQGFDEVITFSMINQESLEKIGLGEAKYLKIQNPLTQDQEVMRPTLLPSLLSVVQMNINRGQKNLKFFEIGKTYTHKGEKETLGMVMTGFLKEDWRKTKNDGVDFYDLKGCLENVFLCLDIKNISFDIGNSVYLKEGVRANIFLGSKNIGVIGAVTSSVLKALGIKQPDVFFAQIELELLYEGKAVYKKYKPITEFPAVIRDVSLAVKKNVSFQQIKELVIKCGGKYLESVSFIEQYLGDKIPSGYRGLVFSLRYVSTERTLKEEEVNDVQEKIEKELIEKLKVIRR